MARSEEAIERDGIGGQQLALLLGALVFVLILVWFFVLRSGGSDPSATTQAPPANAIAVAETPAAIPELTGRPGRGPVETFEVFAPKDPFAPLVGATGGGDGGSNDGPSAAAPTGPSGAPAPGAATGSAVAGHTVRLIDVFKDGGTQRAQVQVDGTVYTVDEGETFAESFQVLSVSGDCASMLYGDDQFTLCEGEEILK